MNDLFACISTELVSDEFIQARRVRCNVGRLLSSFPSIEVFWIAGYYESNTMFDRLIGNLRRGLAIKQFHLFIWYIDKHICACSRTTMCQRFIDGGDVNTL